MKKIMMMALVFASITHADLLITMVEDGDLSSAPRFVEIYNTGSSAVDLDAVDIRLGRSLNGADPVYSDLTGTIAAGGFAYLITTEDETQFVACYGSGLTLITAVQADGNGDDAYILSVGRGDTILDVFGVSGTDGTGANWEYTDGVMRRSNSNTVASASFNYATPDAGAPGVGLTGWSFTDLNGVAEGNYSTTAPIGTWAAVPEPAVLSMVGLGGLLILVVRRFYGK